MSLRCLPSSFGSIRLAVWEEMSFEEFQDGHHRGLLLPEQNDLSNYESLRRSDASRQVSAQSDLRFGRYRLECFKMAAMAAILDIRTERF